MLQPFVIESKVNRKPQVNFIPSQHDGNKYYFWLVEVLRGSCKYKYAVYVWPRIVTITTILPQPP